MAVEERETGTLIGSDKVEGTPVYGSDGTRIGSIERVMIEKVSGNVAYAELSFGGFLGMTNSRTAPRYGHDETWDWGDPSRVRGVSDYYGLPYTPY
jgi:uncharacterized protein YrrD